MDNFVKFQFKFNIMDEVIIPSGLEGIITKRYLSEPVDFVVGKNDVSILEETYDVYELGTFSVDELNAK